MNETCKRVERLLDYFLEGSLSEHEKAFIEKHLNECPDCLPADPEEDWLQAMTPLPDPKCPDNVEDAVFTAVRSMQDQKAVKGIRHLLFGWRGALAGAAAAVILMVAIHSPEPPQESAQTEFTQAEIEQAREVLKWSLAYSAQTVQKKEKSTLDQVFGNYIPKSVQRSARKILPLFTGGEQ